MEKTICELFAGVGGFGLGFKRLDSGWNNVWYNQWEPSRKKQAAYDCYKSHFGVCLDLNGEDHTGEDIALVDKKTIPDHTLLVGGFPCQDYSIAKLRVESEHGINGKKGVLWWQIRDTLEAKRPPFCIFENVDRLLKSPTKQRGRDFAIMLKCLDDLDYSVEWRVINAAEYGGPQRRRRTYIFAYRNDTNYAFFQGFDLGTILSDGMMARAFPVVEVKDLKVKEVVLPSSVYDISDNYSGAFMNAGIMSHGEVIHCDVIPAFEDPIPLGDLLESGVDEKYYITDPEKLERWKYLKGSKKCPRVSPDGHEYSYFEGAMAFPDPLDRPARTMITSEGNIDRSSHVVEDPETKRLRILTPLETERIQGFDDNWTQGMSERMRYFCMGNALVVPMITRMGKVLDEIIDNEG